ncbi:hypothetical protein E4U23_007054 [Claviceps purpurea]|nr:hypothetical protein E4U23_007054 [Claviceps purpurea]
MPKKKDWGTASRSSARQASKKLDEEPDSKATAANCVQQEEDVVPGTFPDDEHNIALPSIEQANDSYTDESSVLSDFTQLAVNDQILRDTQPIPPSKEMADAEPPAWALPLIAALPLLEQLKPDQAKEKKKEQSVPRHSTPAEHSAFGGTDFKPTGHAAHKSLTPFGDNQDAENPDYDRRARETRSQPDVFEDDKEKFESERHVRRATTPNISKPAVDIKKLVNLTQEEARIKGICFGCGIQGHRRAECPNTKHVIQAFRRTRLEDPVDAQDLSESDEEESGNDSDY